MWPERPLPARSRATIERCEREQSGAGGLPARGGAPARTSGLLQPGGGGAGGARSVRHKRAPGEGLREPCRPARSLGKTRVRAYVQGRVSWSERRQGRGAPWVQPGAPRASLTQGRAGGRAPGKARPGPSAVPLGSSGGLRPWPLRPRPAREDAGSGRAGTSEGGIGHGAFSRGRCCLLLARCSSTRRRGTRRLRAGGRGRAGGPSPLPLPASPARGCPWC